MDDLVKSIGRLLIKNFNQQPPLVLAYCTVHCISFPVTSLLLGVLFLVPKLRFEFEHANIIAWMIMIRAAIRPIFSGHVLFFRVKNTVRAEFLNLAKCPGFWINDHLSLFPIKSML